MPITKGLIKFATCSARQAFLSRALARPRLTGKGVCQPKEAAARGLSVNSFPPPRPLDPRARSGAATARRRSPTPRPRSRLRTRGPFFFNTPVGRVSSIIYFVGDIGFTCSF